MCAIVGSFSRDKFNSLMNLNMYRGAFSFSITIIDPLSLTTNTYKSLGQFDPKLFDSIRCKAGSYYLGHTQAPTGGLVRDIKRVHPAENSGLKLWHNGILKSLEIERLQKELSSSCVWDTQLFLDYTYQKNSSGLGPILSEIDGSFACAYLKENDFLYIFRNSPGILFVDSELNISSTKFNQSELLKSNCVYSLDLVNKKINEVTTFSSKSDPYFFVGDE